MSREHWAALYLQTNPKREVVQMLTLIYLIVKPTIWLTRAGPLLDAERAGPGGVFEHPPV